MRIIAGQWRGRPLLAPKGELTRPTADRTRETLFSMLVSRLGTFEGLRIADLYAGSGALAFEALSRGAARAVLVENDRAALTAIEANAAKLGAMPAIELRAMSAARLPRQAPFDLVFADPPYALDPTPDLAALVSHAWLVPGSLVIVERARRSGPPAWPDPLVPGRVRRYGDTELHWAAME